MTRPDRWVIIKITNEGKDPIYKVYGSWIGGYVDGDTWKLNSGIVKVEKEGDLYKFFGASGSCYYCSEGAYGTGTSWTTAVLVGIIEKGNMTDSKITILPEDTDWLNLIE